MPRPIRLDFAGAFWHIYNRGVDRRSIYDDESDRLYFHDLLGQVCSEYKWRVLSYSQMTNHYHAFVNTLQPTLSRGMHKLDGDFAKFFNKRHSRSGALFKGRFDAKLVDSETYLLELSRYIELNAVRGGIVHDPADWRWSSYAATAGLAPAPEWLDCDEILARFDAHDKTRARRLYREFVLGGIGINRSPWDDLRDDLYLGSTSFIERIVEMSEDLEMRPRDRKALCGLPSLDLLSIEELITTHCKTALRPRDGTNDLARLAFVRFARTEAVASYSTIANWLSLTPPGARSMALRATALEQSNPEMRAEFSRIERMIAAVRTGMRERRLLVPIETSHRDEPALEKPN